MTEISKMEFKMKKEHIHIQKQGTNMKDNRKKI